MLLTAIYGYLIFSVSCGGVLALLLWLDNRSERLQEEAQNANETTSTASVNDADNTASQTQVTMLKNDEIENRELESEAA